MVINGQKPLIGISGIDYKIANNKIYWDCSSSENNETGFTLIVKGINETVIKNIAIRYLAIDGSY